MAGAIALYRTLLRERPGLIEARKELALLLARAGEDPLAISELELVLDARPSDSRALYALAELYRKSGQCPKAVELYRKLILSGHVRHERTENQRAPNGFGQAGFEAGLGLCMDLLGKTDEAVAHLERAVSLGSPGEDVRLRLAYGLLRLGKASASLPHFDRLFQGHSHDPGFLNHYVKALVESGQPERAKTLLQGLVETPEPLHGTAGMAQAEADLSWAVSELVSLYLREGDARSAENTLEAGGSSRLHELHPSLLKSLARFYFTSTKYLRCLEALRACVAKQPDDTEALLLMAKAYERLQLLAPAADAYEALLRLQQEPETTLGLVELLLKMEDYQKIAPMLKGGLRDVLSASSTGQVLLARFALGTGDARESAAILEKSPELLQQYDILLRFTALGHQYAAETSCRSHLPLLAKALRIFAGRNERNPQLLQRGIHCLLAGGQYEAAETILEQCWEARRSFWAVNILVDHALRNKDNPSEALKWIQRGLEVYPSSARLRLAQIRILSSAGHLREARAALGMLRPEVPGTWFEEQRLLAAGTIACLSGKYGLALEIWDRMLKSAPNHLGAREARVKTNAAYGLWREALAEADGLRMLTGGAFLGPISMPKLFLKEREVPTPGACLASDSSQHRPLCGHAAAILSGCEDDGEGCKIHLAIAYEQEHRFDAALTAWESFLESHETYWPGYQKVSSLHEQRQDGALAKQVKTIACRAVRRHSRAGGGGDTLAAGADIGSSSVLREGRRVPKDGDGTDVRSGGLFPDNGSTPGPLFWEMLQERALAGWAEHFCGQ